MSAVSAILAIATLGESGVEDAIVTAMETTVPHLSRPCLERLALIVGGELIDRPVGDLP